MTWERIRHPDGKIGSDVLLIAANNTYNEWRQNVVAGVDPEVLRSMRQIQEAQERVRAGRLPDGGSVVVEGEALPWEDDAS